MFILTANFTGSLILDWVVYAAIIFICGYFFTIYERNKIAKEKRQNELLEIERNVSTFDNHLLGCTYDFALKTIRIFYLNVDELRRPDGLRIITAEHYDEYGYYNKLEWLFQTIYKKKEVCINYLITLPSNRVDTILNKKIKGVEYILHPAKDGDSIVQMIYHPKIQL